MSPALILILKSVLPVVVGPCVTWVIKKVLPSIPAGWKPIISAIAGSLSAVFAGDATVLATALEISPGVVTAATAITGIAGGLAGSKGRDLLQGKSVAVDPQSIPGLSSSR